MLDNSVIVNKTIPIMHIIKGIGAGGEVQIWANDLYNSEVEWCKSNVGKRGDSWNKLGRTFMFSRPEDATAFKLTFGL